MRAQGEHVDITRESLASGSQLAVIRANAPPGMTVLSDAELQESLTAALDSHPPNEDLYLFAYGSLIWNPAFEYVGREKATIEGWSRKFCLWMHMGRGTPERPGLMLALDKGGTCEGILFRLSAATAKRELGLVWVREMFSSAYLARWVNAKVGDRIVQALTFVINPQNPRYISGLSAEHSARYIGSAEGSLGTCLAYFDSLRSSLGDLGVSDPEVDRIGRYLS